MGFGGVLDRGSVPDVAVHQDQGGTLMFCLEDPEPAGDRVEVVGVGDGGDIPAVGEEAGGHVLGEGDAGVPLDGDPV